METATRHIAIFPTPGIGRLIPLVQFANHLTTTHQSFKITFIIPNDGTSMKSQKKLLESLPKSTFSTIFLPPVTFHDLPQDAKIETRIYQSTIRSLSCLRDTLKVLTETTNLVAMVVDLFGVLAIDVAREFGVDTYVFFTTSAMVLSFFFMSPEFDGRFSCEYRDLSEVKIPGCVPVHGSDLPEPFLDKQEEPYNVMVSLGRKFRYASGVLVNSFVDMEPGGFNGLIEGGLSFGVPVYPVGPMVRTGLDSVDGDYCLKWLDRQPSGSVLFVCFGSGGTLSRDQLQELAFGLELSGKRFLWVVKRPNDVANGTYFGAEMESNGVNECDKFLPNGFLDRTKDVGLVVQNWAPQAQVLSHGSTGGFLSHCGWNSTLESVVNGVPMIAWPLFAEQKMNAVFLSDGLKVGLRVKASENGLVMREDIGNYVRELFDGEYGKLMRINMKKLEEKAKDALKEDGSSTKSLASVAEVWKNSVKE